CPPKGRWMRRRSRTASGSKAPSSPRTGASIARIRPTPTGAAPRATGCGAACRATMPTRGRRRPTNPASPTSSCTTGPRAPPATPRNGEKGRATKWTALAYKGKVQVYAHDYAGAITTLNAVVASGAFGLETSFDHVWTGFQQFADGPETILAYQASANDGEPDGNNANWGERLNFPHSDSPFGCCGFHQPSQNLLNAFVVDDSGLPKALTNPTWNARN